MQEQHHYKTTPEQGWSGMLQVLDQAMPVATRQRRFIFFWWTAAAVSTAAIVAMFVLINSNAVQLPVMVHSDIKPTNSIEKKITDSAPVTKPAETSTATITQNDHKNSISAPAPDSQNSTATAKSVRSYKNTIEKGDPLNSGSSNLIVNNESKLSAPGSVNITESITEANNQKSSIEENESIVVPEEIVDPKATSGQFRMDEVMTSLPLSEIALFERETELMDDIQPGKINKLRSKGNLITPHVSAGIIDGFENGIGMRAAAGVNLNVTPRLSLTSDIGYSIYSPDATLIGCTNCQEEFDTDGFLRNDLAYEGIDAYLPAETVYNASNGSLNSFVSTIRQLQFSAGLKYDLSRRFFAEGGVALGFGTTAHSSYPIISFDNSSPASGDPLKISHSFDNVIKSNTTSAYAGIGYRLSPKAELYATATHSFDHYFLDNPSYGPVEASERKDYIRGLNVGFRYNFQGP